MFAAKHFFGKENSLHGRDISLTQPALPDEAEAFDSLFSHRESAEYHVVE